MIQTSELVKNYGKNMALDGVSFEVAKGEAFALLGPNGAGKTTIIKVLLDFSRADHGTARINGLPSTKSESRKKVGYLAENIRLPQHLNAVDFLKRTAALRDENEAADRILPLLEKVGLKGKETFRTLGYSKGMKQRLGLAAALLCDPQVLILDEPSTGLDPIGIREFRLILEDLKNRGVTILLNSHVLSEVERLCDSAAIMNRGKILVKGRLSELVKDGETLEDVFVRYVSADQS
ncbi:MAG: ABC transporter ATP-binding protein [Chitinispirillaceae bacterium]